MNQIISKKRVAEHGEVFTSEREVNAMLDLVKQETNNIDSRFLEPACGSGNFLSEILRRKLSVVENRYKKSQLAYERYSFIAVSSLYGIELLEDNAEDCRLKLLNIFNKNYKKKFKSKCKDELRNSIKFILQKNIVCGDALTLKTVGEKPFPITFSEWSIVTSSMVKRRDYYFETLSDTDKRKKVDLFSSNDALKSDIGKEVFIPHPVKTYSTTHFLKIADG
jgi:hypothetical protein